MTATGLLARRTSDRPARANCPTARTTMVHPSAHVCNLGSLVTQRKTTAFIKTTAFMRMAVHKCVRHVPQRGVAVSLPSGGCSVRLPATSPTYAAGGHQTVVADDTPPAAGGGSCQSFPASQSNDRDRESRTGMTWFTAGRCSVGRSLTRDSTPSSA
jgi:hypothetical protein